MVPPGASECQLFGAVSADFYEVRYVVRERSVASTLREPAVFAGGQGRTAMGEAHLLLVGTD